MPPYPGRSAIHALHRELEGLRASSNERLTELERVSTELRVDVTWATDRLKELIEDLGSQVHDLTLAVQRLNEQRDGTGER
jgi:hypothetical protein